MKPNTIRLLCASGLLTLLAHSAAAQEGLMDIYQRALQNDPAIREAEARFLASSEARPQARAQLLPSLSFGMSTSGSFSEDPNPPTNPITGENEPGYGGTEADSDSTGWQINVNQTVFDWSQILSLKQADKRVAQAQADYEAQRQQLLIRVAEAYFAVLSAEDSLEAQQVARQAFERQLEQAQRRFEVGLIAITDVQETQAGFDSAVAQEIEAQRVLATEQERLREIIGEYVTELASPDEEIPLVSPDPRNPDEWVQVALRQNLALISARLAADIAQDDISIQRASRLPTLSFSSGYRSNRTEREQITERLIGDLRRRSLSESEGYNWQLQLQVPLFTGGLNSSRIQQSVYLHRAQVQAAERVARETERATRDAFLGVESSISRVRALRQAVESAQTALRATEAGYEVGTRTSVEVQQSLEQLTRAQTDYARARYEYILNTLRLKQAAGTLTVEDIEQIDGWLERESES
ncbi:MAG TPA: TolC family outer membrane protein [Gammaproteobacteria bacterium]